MERPMKRNDLSKSLVAFEQDSTLVAVIELSENRWVVGALVPGLTREPLKALPADQDRLLHQLHRWRDEAVKAGKKIERIAVAMEAGRGGFWLARWLRTQGIESYIIHPSSVPVAREHRRPKSDRLDTALLMRAFLGWLRGEAKHCSMVAIPTLAQEDAQRPSREHEYLVRERTSIVSRIKSAMARHGIREFKIRLRYISEELDRLRTAEGYTLPPNTVAELRRDVGRLQLLRNQILEIEKERQEHLRRAPKQGTHAMLLLLAKVLGIGLETADMLVHEVLWRNLRDERAVGRYGGMTGSPHESGSKRQEKGLAKAGNARVRRVMVQLAWRWLKFQKESALTQWFFTRTAGGPRGTRKKMIVALARKLLIALWRYVNTGELPAGVKLKAAAI
jgi:transposase